MYHLVAALIVGGGFGGFLAAFGSSSLHQLSLPHTDGRWSLGFIGDILIGVGSAIAAYALLTNVLPPDKTAPDYAIRVAGFGLATGFAGLKIMRKVSLDFLKEKQDSLSSDLTVVRLVERGRDELNKKRYASAVDTFEKALALSPHDIESKLLYATALSFKESSQHKRPVKLLKEVIASQPDNSKAHYNMACIMALNTPEYTMAEIFDSLEQAVALDTDYAMYAKGDPDWDALRSDGRFQQIIT
ncbi:MAG: hypothetical protein V4675_21985 [Verrucomicrobiota bacterium]